MRKHLLASLFLMLLCPSLALAAEVGESLKQVELKSGAGDDKPASIPDLGSKVIALFYTDADVSDMNDPLADALKAKNFDKATYRGLGVANLQDSKAPNFLIRSIVKGKVEKYKTTILLDPNLSLATAWGFGDCNNNAVVVVIGPDSKVKYIHKGPVRGADIDSTVKLVESLIADLNASKAAIEAPAAAQAPAAPNAPVQPTP